jgi:hypothetical protein
MSTNTPQIVYDKFPTAGGAGRIYDVTEYFDVVTGVDQADVAGVPFGVMLTTVVGSQPTTPGSETLVKLPAEAGDVAFPLAFGVSVQTVLIENLDVFNQASNVYPQGRPIACMKKGRIWVPTETEVAVGDEVFVRFEAGGNGTQLGAFGNTADSASCAQLTTAKWFQGGGGSATSFAVLEVNF